MTAQTGRLNYPRHALIVTIPVSWGNKHTLSQDDLGKVVEAIEKIEQPVLHETLNEDDDEPIGERNEMVEALEIMVLRASKGRDERVDICSLQEILSISIIPGAKKVVYPYFSSHADTILLICSDIPWSRSIPHFRKTSTIPSIESFLSPAPEAQF